jgi:hypothetical protein
MSTILQHFGLWVSIDSEPIMLAAAMCVVGAYVLTQMLKNVALGVVYYPVLVISSVVCIGLGMQFGFIGHWYSSMASVLAAICIGMSLSAMILLGVMALLNRSA